MMKMMSQFDFNKVKNVFILGAGVSVGRGIPIGSELLKDIFRIYEIDGREEYTNNEGPDHEKHYREVMAICKKLYNLKDARNVDRIRDFGEKLNPGEIDFEDYLSRIYLSNLLKDFEHYSKDFIEPNLMRLLYWYFWHHINNWPNPKEFPNVEAQDDYIKTFLNKLDNSSAILTTNIDLVFEGRQDDYQNWDVSYRPDWLQKNQKLYLKLHGSVNWICRWSLPKQIHRTAYISEGQRFFNFIPQNVDDFQDVIIDSKHGNNIKLIHTYFKDIPGLKVNIMPPILYKGIYQDDVPLNLMIDEVWGNATKCLGNADNIIFAGLSLRDTDIMLQLLLKQNIQPDARIYLNNLPSDFEKDKPKEQHEIYRHYNRFFNISRDDYFDCTFQDSLCVNIGETPPPWYISVEGGEERPI